MGDLNLSTMRDEVTLGLLNQSSDDLTDPHLNRWINWAYRHVAHPKVFRHPELQGTQAVTLVEDDFDYALASDTLAVYNVTQTTTDYKVWPRSVRQLDELKRYTGARMSFYAIYARTLITFPTPNASAAGDVLTVRYWQRPAVLSGDSDVTVLPAEWDEIIVYGAIWRGWAFLQEHARKEQAKIDFAELLNDMTDVQGIQGEDTGQAFEVEVNDYQTGSVM